MNTLVALYRSTVGKKLAMAVSGGIYIGWVLFHLLGNLQFHLGPIVMNDYAHMLQSNPEIVWPGRLFLLTALLVHVISAVSLIRGNASARPVDYQGGRVVQKTTPAARSMRQGGMFLLFFLFVHICDLTLRAYVPFVIPLEGSLGYMGAELGYIRGEVFHNMVLTFTNPITLLFYVLGMIFLGLHLFHGVYSAAQTLGQQGASSTNDYRRLAALIAMVVVLGNLSIVGHGLVIGTAVPRATVTGHGAEYYAQKVDVPGGLKVPGGTSGH